MLLKSLAGSLLAPLRQARRKVRLQQIKTALQGEGAWEILEQLKIPGFGKHLLRVFYPVETPLEARWGGKSASHKELEQFFNKHVESYNRHLPVLESVIPQLISWPVDLDPQAPLKPHLCNSFFPFLDSLALYGFLTHLKPTQYIEIGSGLSTKIAHQARSDSDLNMKIISIDPEPRQEIDHICDRVVRKRLEDIESLEELDLKSGDVLFFDGSHYCFPGNDVVTFFFEILPSLPQGVIVHIHDIFLPDDYPNPHLEHLWSEQYLLAAWLLGGAKGIDTFFPCAFMAKTEGLKRMLERIDQELTSAGKDSNRISMGGASFWFTKSLLNS